MNLGTNFPKGCEVEGESGDRNPVFDVLRLLAAMSVVAFHCFALTDNWTSEPLWKISHGRLNLAILGVSTFFVISGYLVTRSYLYRAAIGQFVIARVLRIYPALILATLFTIAMAATSTTLSWGRFVLHSETLGYLMHTASGFSVRDRLPGAFESNPFPNAVNGSLWTLPIELRLYVAVAAAGVVGLFRYRAMYALLCGATVGVCVFAPQSGGVIGIPQEGALYVAEFAVGSGIAVGAVKLQGAYRYLLLVLATVGVFVGVVDPFKATFIVSIAYVVLAIAAFGKNLKFRLPGDYSYGLYVYSFPIQQVLVRHDPGITPLALFALTLLGGLPVAATSWHLMERPFLSLKNRGPRPTVTHVARL